MCSWGSEEEAGGAAAGLFMTGRPGPRVNQEGLSCLSLDISYFLFAIQVLDPNMDLRTVKHFIWKSGGDLTLHYRQKST